MTHFDTGSDQRPPMALFGAEPFRAAMEFAWHTFGWPATPTPGDGHPVVIFPGLGADGNSVATLRAHCRSLGYQAFDWGQGTNTGPRGDLETWLQTLKSQMVELLRDHTQPATFIGWSLGGVYAREVAKLMAPGIRQVITMGTPFNMRGDHTHVSSQFHMLNGSFSTIYPWLNQRLRTPPPMRTTSIYSKSDGIVDWQSCRHDTQSSLVQDIEVDGSHMGMGWNRDVLAAVADRLAQPTGPCQRYEPAPRVGCWA